MRQAGAAAAANPGSRCRRHRGHWLVTDKIEAPRAKAAFLKSSYQLLDQLGDVARDGFRGAYRFTEDAADLDLIGRTHRIEGLAGGADRLIEAAAQSGPWYYRIARGIDERAVQPDRPRKSVGAEDTFATDIFELETARDELAPLIEKVWCYCQDRSIRGRTVTLKVKFSDFQQITRSRTAHSFIDRANFEQIGGALLDQVFPVEKGVRLLGVTISNLGANDSAEPAQLSLIS